jgi:hypothetical protein
LSRPEESSSSRRHRVNAIDARIRPFIFESQQRRRATSAGERSLDERVIYFSFFLDPTTNAPRRTLRVDARETRARRDDASMDDESSRSSDDRPRSMMIFVAMMRDGMKRAIDTRARASEDRGRRGRAR